MTLTIDEIIERSNRTAFDVRFMDMLKSSYDEGVRDGWITPSAHAVEEFEVDGVAWVRLERRNLKDKAEAVT